MADSPPHPVCLAELPAKVPLQRTPASSPNGNRLTKILPQPLPQEHGLNTAFLGGEEVRTSRDGTGQRLEGVVVRKEESRQHLWAQCPERWGKDGQAGLCWWHLFWVFCRAGPPWVSRAARITWREMGMGRGVWTNWHIHDRCLLRKIQ